MFVRIIKAVKAIKRTPSDIFQVKSDRINALRKQYDAFLEEDKKRKNRNEYILGWLDRVRSCPPLQHKEKPFLRTKDSEDIIPKTPEFISRYQTPVPCTTNVISTYTKNLNETTILKEISKSYILIPKKYAVPENNCRDPLPASSNETDDTDWKSKYDILNELKQNEKEDYTKKENKEEIVNQHLNEFIHNSPQNVYEKFNIAEKDENSEKNPNINETQYDKQQINKNIQDLTPYSNENQISTIQQKDGYANIICNNSPDEQKAYSNNKDLHSKIENNFTNKPEQLISKQSTASHENLDLKPEIQHADKEQYNEINDHHQPKTTTANIQPELNVLTLSNTDSINTVKLAGTEPIFENSINVSNHQEMQQNENIDTHSNENIDTEVNPSDTKDSTLVVTDLQYQSENSEIETTGLIENVIDGDRAQIEEYENEQKQLFYSDDPNQNYAYNEEAGQNTTSNEIHENNDQYSYYEAVKDESNYGTEINEHVESTERYDPNYEQQYVNQYDGNPNQYQNENYEDGYYNVQEQNQDYQQQQYENYDQQNYQYQQSDNPIEEQQQYDNDNTYEIPVAEQENPEVVYEQDISAPTQIAQNESQMDKPLDFEDGYDADQKTVEKENILDNIISPVEGTQDIEQTTNSKTT